MPYQPHLEPTVPPLVEPTGSAASDLTPATANHSWRTGLPLLMGHLITLRELRVSAAPALFAAPTSEQVTRAWAATVCWSRNPLLIAIV